MKYNQEISYCLALFCPSRYNFTGGNAETHIDPTPRPNSEAVRNPVIALGDKGDRSYLRLYFWPSAFCMTDGRQPHRVVLSYATSTVIPTNCVTEAAMLAASRLDAITELNIRHV